MADNLNTSALPPPPSSAGAPGYEGPPGTTTAHMPPPPLPPVVIPQNNNPLPTQMNVDQKNSFMKSEDGDTPNSGGGQVRRAAPEPNKRALYVGGLDVRVTEEVLKQIFETTGHVRNVKIIPDKNEQFGNKGLNYGFVEYDDPRAAEQAMLTLNGRRVHQSEIRVNWAYQSNSNIKEDTSNHFHIFVGDLSNEVNDEVLLQAFSAFGSVSEARVMWDMKTGRSRGYGFVAFRDRPDAEKALSSMDGEWLGSRAIRCNWANQKGQPSISAQSAMDTFGMTPTTPFGHHQFPQGIQSYDTVVAQTPSWQTTCYVGNLTPYTTQNDLVPLFSNFGPVVETRIQSDRGFAFIKMDSHENAALAICHLSGYSVNGRQLKCSWGKDRPPTGNFEGFSPTSLSSAGTPGGFNPQSVTPGAYNPQPGTQGGYNPQSPYFPQYGGPGQISPQGPPAGRNGWDQTQMQQSQYSQAPIQQYSPQGYGRAQSHSASGMYQTPVQNYGAYQGYQS